MENYLKPKNERRVDVYFEQELFDRLKKYAKEKHASWTEVIRYSVREYLNKELPKKY